MEYAVKTKSGHYLSISKTGSILVDNEFDAKKFETEYLASSKARIENQLSGTYNYFSFKITK